ncbi:hypothetical protein K7957_09455 [Sphingomonas yunnanensis]|uniref:Rap1a/Tai family immunity protein n=1 Tax=Sphingomonas yunnanensis TaxID=310400 RepID=UPI001CA6D01C|nr:Rap1a/Tai family immunity protein [Sphingomonas yunnanensis]MBY9063159.1 hypothetical protein [Sphingomonas yunnanensis]
MSTLLLAAMLAAADRPVVVSSLTTPQLVELCRGRDDDPTADFCTGYMLAAFDALSSARQICPAPDRSSNVAVTAAARRYLRKQGKKSSAAPAFVVRQGLKEAFPCKPAVKPKPKATSKPTRRRR